ncbi:MAG: glycosyltransferase family 4 protein [Planctomycetes bacterium]|nr:glycosyltransferase family 4 protein [Planctomycetota bacterium]
MRIGLDYRPALINREGIGRVTRELVRALCALEGGHELRLFGWSLAAAKFERAELGLDARRASMTRLRFPSRWIPRLCALTGKGADDLAGGTDLWHHTQPSTLPVRAAVETATVFDCIYLRDDGFLSKDAAASMERSVRGLIERSKLVLVPSAFVADDVARSFGVAREKLVVTHLGCDHVLRHAPKPAPEREPFLLTVARVDPRKNHARILAAFERLVRAGFSHRWVVAGPPGHRAHEFEAALDRSSARDQVEWRRDVGERELAELYARCALFVFPSLDEGFGLPPLEAMALGAPVVASTSGSLPEVLGDAALSVDARDEDALHAAMRRVLTEPELAHDLARRGLEQSAHFTWRACAQSTLAAWESAFRA